MKKKNKTALFFFSTYKILWPNPYYQIHGQILLTLSVNNKQRLHLNQEVYLIEDINVWYWEYNENLFLSLYFKNTVDVLFWSIVLDIVVAIKITF